MNKIFLLILIISILMSACQPTPGINAVQSKSDGIFEQVISEGEKIYENDDKDLDGSEVLVKTVEKQAEMISIGAWYDNNVEGNQNITISSDAQILMPNVNQYIAYQIIPLSPIPEDILRKLMKLIVEDSLLYDGNENSLEEIENNILSLRQTVFDFENDEFKESFSEEQGRTYEEYKADEIENLQKLISTMEEDVQNGNYGNNTVVDIDEINFDNSVKLKADLGRDELAVIMKLDQYSFSIKNPGNYGIDYRGETISEFVPEEEKELEISDDYALGMINTLLYAAGIQYYDIRYMGICKEYNGNEELGYGHLEQGYIMIFSRIVNGMPVECSSDFDISVLEDGSIDVINYTNSFKYYDENLSFVVDDIGITQMDWQNYYDIDYQSARAVEIMQMDDELKNIIAQQIINCYSFYEDQNRTAHFYIDRVELVMGRVPMKDNPDKQWLVPMWNVYANYEIDSAGEEMFRTETSRLILSINALDGSIN